MRNALSWESFASAERDDEAGQVLTAGWGANGQLGAGDRASRVVPHPLRFSSAVVRLSVYTTPFAPFWVAGVRVHDLRLAGECAEYSRVPSQEDIGILQALELTLRSTAAEAAALPPVSRKLPGGLPLKSVKMIACQLFKVEPAAMQLLYCPPGQEKEIPELLEDESKPLAELGVVSGGTIVIDEVA